MRGTDPTCRLAHAPRLLEELGKSWRNTRFRSTGLQVPRRGRRSVSWRPRPLSKQQGDPGEEAG